MFRIQRYQCISAAVLVGKLNLKSVGRILLHNSPNLAAHKPMLRQVANKCYYVILFDAILHSSIVPLNDVACYKAWYNLKCAYNPGASNRHWAKRSEDREI